MKNDKKVQGYPKIVDKFSNSGARANELVNEGYQPRKAISIAAMKVSTPTMKKK